MSPLQQEFYFSPLHLQYLKCQLECFDKKQLFGCNWQSTACPKSCQVLVVKFLQSSCKLELPEEASSRLLPKQMLMIIEKRETIQIDKSLKLVVKQVI